MSFMWIMCGVSAIMAAVFWILSIEDWRKPFGKAYAKPNHYLRVMGFALLALLLVIALIDAVQIYRWGR